MLTTQVKSPRVRRRKTKPLIEAVIQALESRLLLSTETATAQLTLLSTTGSKSHPTYNYSITLNDTGSTTIGTFWFGWVPGEDFLKSAPISVQDPSGWTHSVIGADNSQDGSSIQWTSQSSGADVTAGDSLTGFTFSSADSPTQISGNSPAHPGTPVETSFIYVNGPEQDPGFSFVVSNAPQSNTGTSTTLAASARSVNIGDNVSFTATVAPATSGSAAVTGSVTFVQGSTTLGSAPILTGGKAVFSTSSLAIGPDSIIANYSGDGTHNASASTPFTETIKGSTRLAIAAGPQATVAGQTINVIMVDVEGATGHLDATDDSNVTIAIATGPKDANLAGTLTIPATDGVATFSDLSLTKSGAYTLIATDTGLTSAKSAGFAITPDASTSQLALVAPSSASGVVGKPLPNVVVHVVDQFDNLITTNPSTATFSIATGPTGGSITTNTNALATSGVATFKGITLGLAGSYSLEATDPSLQITTPVTFSQTIIPATTTLAAPSVAGSYAFGKTITLSTTIKSNAPSAIIFTGDVTVTDQNSDGIASGTVSASGAVHLTVSSDLSVGVYTCTLTYAGDANHMSIAAKPFTLHIVKAATTIALVPSTTDVPAGQGVTLTATLSSAAGVTPTGSIIFMDGATQVGSVVLSGDSTVPLTISDPTPGMHAYTAIYSGDANFTGSKSPAKKVSVA